MTTTRHRDFAGIRIFLVSISLAVAGLFLAPSILLGQRQQEETPDQQGIDALKKKDLDTAIADFSNAIQTNPRDAQAYLLRGQICAAKGAYDISHMNDDSDSMKPWSRYDAIKSLKRL